jgi:hypothetical protein
MAAAVATAAAVLPGCNDHAGSELWRRDFDPVVLVGAQVTDLLGATPGDVVAFRWNGEGSYWQQVPVQVDQRHVEYLTKLRNGTGSSGPQTLAYSDPGANAGADPVATLDADDEIAFMADDAGAAAPGGAGDPGGVVAGSGVRVTITDPLRFVDGNRGGGTGYVYLFERTAGGLQPSAGKDYVQYVFAPDDPMGHAEDSTVSTNRYSTHFSARWTRDEIRLAGGVDLLDRHRNLFAVGVCTRSEDTFSAGDGGYATNVDGPVRVIRSYLGANSGTYTQREHVFYRSTERVQTFLRVHAIPGILDFYDYSANAIGMTYSSSSTAGVTIDGVPDTAGTAAPTWEAVTGAPGSIVSTSVLQTSVSGMSVQSYYLDDSTPGTQCTGDAFEYGASGTAVTSGIPNTDPTLPNPQTFTGIRWNVYAPPSTSLGTDVHVANVTTPLTTSVAPYTP